METLGILYTEYNYVGYFAILAFITYNLARGRRKLAITSFLFIYFFKGFSTDFISSLEVWKAASAALLVFIYLNKEKIQVGNAAPGITFAVIAMYFGNSLILQFPGHGSSISTYSGFLYNEGRLITQLFYYAIVFGVFCAPFLLLKKNTDIFLLRGALLYSILLLCTLGWLQFATYQLAGANIFPINRAGDFDYHSNMLYSEGLQNVFRVNSIAGEPKHLGLAISVGLAILLASRQSNPSGENYFYLKLLLLLTTLYVTYSTTGYVTALVAVVTAIAFLERTGKLLAGAAVLAVISAGSLIALDQSYLGPALSRLQRAGLETQDQAIVSALIENPVHSLFGFGIGNIHHYAVSHLPVDFPLFKTTPFKPNNGLLYVISDFGVLGLMAFSTLYFRSLRRLGHIKSRLSAQSERAALDFLGALSCAVFCIFMFRYTELVFFTLGAMIAVIKLNNPKHEIAVASSIANIRAGKIRVDSGVINKAP